MTVIEFRVYVREGLTPEQVEKVAHSVQDTIQIEIEEGGWPVEEVKYEIHDGHQE